MMCDLCTEDSDRIVRAGSLQVCQWCVSNGVLEHALEVESDVAILRHSVDEACATHRLDVANETDAEARLERAYAAYAELTTAMRDLAISTAHSRESLKLALAAKVAFDEYKEKEQLKTMKARQGQQ